MKKTLLAAATGRLRSTWIVMLMLILLGSTAPVALGQPADRSVFRQPVPTGASQLRKIQEVFAQVAEKVIPCTVGLQVGGAQGSGVIVSKDGYVLTAAHVIGRPDREVLIKLPDGTTAKGKTLGFNADADGGMVKITDQGPWPFAPIVPREEVPRAGDWCLATGHPGGFQAARTPPVRIGRVIDVDRFTLRTDCTITGGDSGGPLFDIQGRVIGIHSRISEQDTVNLHAPALAVLDTWDRLKAGEIYPPTPASRFLARFDVDNDGHITRGELPDGLYRRVFDRLVSKFGLDANKSYTIDDLKQAIGWESSPQAGFDPFRTQLRSYRPGGRPGESLGRDRFVRGRAVRAAFQEIVREVGKSTVQVESNGKRVALGVIVDSDGLILTKASQLADKLSCKLHDGRNLPARQLRTDNRYDVALLKIDATDLKAVQWSQSSDLRPGSWLATTGVGGDAVTVGVVSVAQRAIAGAPGVLGVEIGESDKGALIVRVLRNSGASRAGLQPSDVVTHVMGQQVRNLDELRSAVQKHRPGDVVQVTIDRSDKKLDINVTLGALQDSFGNRQNPLDGPLSRRRDNFPAAIQHDSVLHPTECGGPIVDVSGKVVGINVARAERTVTYALPSEAIKSLLDEFNSDTSTAQGED